MPRQARAGRPGRAGLRAGARVAVWLLIALLIVLYPLAAASPPDPAWISGLYDAVDFDDVVIHLGLLASLCAAFGAPLLAVESLVRRLILPGRRPLVRRSRPTPQDRAPPLV